MEREFPYEACANCNYWATQEDLKNYGPRGRFATIDEKKACNEKVCELERALLSSNKLLNKKELKC